MTFCTKPWLIQNFYRCIIRDIGKSDAVHLFKIYEKLCT